MKFIVFVAMLLVASKLIAQPDVFSRGAEMPGRSETEADREWRAIDWSAADTKNEKDHSPKDPKARRQRLAEQATAARSIARQAQLFYTKNPSHEKANEARKRELLALIQATHLGDSSAEVDMKRLAKTIRSDVSLPVSLRAQCAAATDFSGIAQAGGTFSETKEKIKLAARSLTKEFPSEPQGYEALYTICKSAPPVEAKTVASELITSGAPEHIKRGAQTILDGFSLVGKELAEVLGDEAAALLASFPKGQPVIVYSWATWGEGSLQLGRMIQARRFAAIGVCLDELIEPAKSASQRAGLGGVMVYDAKGAAGKLASRLKFFGAGQIYLVDSSGVIREVRVGDTLEAKLAEFNFKTPVLLRPANPRS